MHMLVLCPLSRHLGLGVAAGWPDLSQGTIGPGGGLARGEMSHRHVLRFWVPAVLNLMGVGVGLQAGGWTSSPAVTDLSHLVVDEAL